MLGPGILSLRKLVFSSDFVRWSSGQPVFLHGLDPGLNPGEAQIEEIVTFLAKTGRPRGSSPRPSDSRPGALRCQLRCVGLFISKWVGGFTRYRLSLIRVPHLNKNSRPGSARGSLLIKNRNAISASTIITDLRGDSPQPVPRSFHWHR